MIDNVNSPYVLEANAENFKALVLENSQRGPVLVNFCSQKASPCLRLYPLLDQIVHHYDGRMLLINVDTETEVIITKEYGITSVPTLKLFRNEQIVETRHGFQSEQDLVKLLEPYVARDSDQDLADAVQLYTEGKTVAAYEKIANAIVEDPINHRLPLAMCKLLKHEGRFAEAIKLIDSLPENIRTNPEIDQFHSVLGFYAEADLEGDVEALKEHLVANPDDLPALRQLTVQAVIQQHYEEAMQHLVKMMELAPDYDENYPQQAMLQIFKILGREHPLISKYRPNLNRYTH